MEQWLCASAEDLGLTVLDSKNSLPFWGIHYPGHRFIGMYYLQKGKVIG